MKPTKFDIYTVDCLATLEPPHELTAIEIAAFSAAYEKAAAPLMTDGKPTVMRMTAWMCHEGMNGNRQSFVAEELRAAAAKIGLPNALVMDFNHSAIYGYTGEQRCIGLWYEGEYAWDQRAKDGKGAWGILVKGVMFAWLFPEIADTLQAEQARNGVIKFSMACMAGTTEYATDADGRSYAILHNPVFFTNSALDVPPADADARGLGSESTAADVEAEQRAALVSAASNAQEQTMNGQALKDLLSQLEGRLAEQVTAALNERNAEVIALEARASAAELLVTEKDTALVAVQAQIAMLTQELTEAQTALDVVTAQLAEHTAAAAAAELAAKRTARVAALPEPVRVAHAKRDETKRERLELKWASMSDEDFAVYLEDELGITPMATAAAREGSYLERSQKEGILPTASSDAANSLGERARRHIKQ
jgi:hypothetical protein